MAESLRIDFLRVTMWDTPARAAAWGLRALGLPGTLDDFDMLPTAGDGFKRIFKHASGLLVYCQPATGGDYCSVSMSGAVSSCVAPERLIEGVDYLEVNEIRYSVTRFDLAFDHDLYKPVDVHDAVIADDLRSLAKRSSLKRITEPLKPDSDTVYLGSRTSERMLRVYLKDGHTRTELELKGARAIAVLRDMVAHAPGDWAACALSHLRDFVDFKRQWWDDFCGAVQRAGLKLSRLTSTAEKMRGWLHDSVAPSLAILREVYGGAEVDSILLEGYLRFKDKHRRLLKAGRLAREEYLASVGRDSEIAPAAA